MLRRICRYPIVRLATPTSDVDVLSIAPTTQREKLLPNGCARSELHQKYKVYLDYVGIAQLPYEYESRLTEMYPGVYKKLRLFALDPYDLALTKLARNIQRDREDVRYLARSVPFDLNILKQRYTTEHRPYLMGRPENIDAVFNLWIEIIEEDRRKMPGNQPLRLL